MIFINDVLQTPGKDYIFNGGTRITFNEAPKPGSKFRMYFYAGSTSDFDEIGYQFFNTTGGPDSTVNASLDNDDFKEHQYTANDLDEFIAFSIKIVMQGTNSSEPPRIKDLRAIALAT